MTRKTSMRYSPAVRAHAVRMMQELRDDYPPEWAALGSIAANNQAQLAHVMLYAETQQTALKTAIQAVLSAREIRNKRAELLGRLAASYAAVMLRDFPTAQTHLAACSTLIHDRSRQQSLDERFTT